MKSYTATKFRTSALTLFVLLSFAFSMQCKAWVMETGSLDNWFAHLKIFRSNIDPMAQYFTEDKPADIREYSEKVFSVYKDKLKEALVKIHSVSAHSCKSFAEVKFDEDLTNSARPKERDFEGELIQIESQYCLKSTDIEKVAAVFYSDAFQTKYISGLKYSMSNQNKNEVCQKTSVFMVGNSDFCINYSFWKNTTELIGFSYNTSSKIEASAPVYLRLVTTVFRKLDNDEVLVYNLTFGRGPNLSMHPLVKSIVSKQHIELMQSLARDTLFSRTTD